MTPAYARILFEDSGDESGFAYDGVYLSALAAHMTDRQLIGGPANLYNDRHHFAHFYSGRLLDRPIGEYSDEDLKEILELYNIGAIVAFHPSSVERLLGLRGWVRLDRRLGRFALMQVEQPRSWSLRGSAKVEASLNRIRCTEAAPEDLILKFHWVDGLRGEPEVAVEPVRLNDDPIPFIRIRNPPPEFTLRIGR